MTEPNSRDEEPHKVIQGLAALHQQASSLPSSRSGSASSLPLLIDRHNNNLETHRHSVWECETTPMTTRPHFERYDGNSPPRPMRRIRSRSVGSAVEREHEERIGRGSLLLPLMDWDVYDLRAPHHRAERRSISKDNIPVPSTISPAVSQVSFKEPPKDLEIEETLTKEDEEEKGQRDLPAWVNVLYGMINATIVLPVLMSFGSIIYRDDAFAPYIPVLVKLTLVSGIVHQLCFSTFSSLPFAVGQVQVRPRSSVMLL